MVEITPLPDLSDAAPAGENLELDAEFGAMERATRGKAEAQYGDTIIPAEPPDWKAAEGLCVALLERSRDLRIMTQLAITRLNMSGVPGFAEMLRQIRFQLENRWDHVHPQLDPEDDNDPTLRANALVRLQDPAVVLRTMRNMPLATTPQTGPICWRDIAVFRGAMEAEDGRAKPTEAAIRGAFANTNPERMQLVRDAVASALQDAAAIPAAFDAQAGSGSGPDFTNLQKLLQDIQKELRAFETGAGAAEAASEPAPDDADLPADGAPTARRAGGAQGGMTIRSISGVSNRDDALYLLDLVSVYFRTQEPSNPAPMLIDRARRLATMEFLDILRDLAPDGLGQAQNIAGPQPE